MVYFSALFDVGQAITHAFRTLAGIIATLIYDGVAWAYDLFTYIARAEILDNDFVNEIYRKVGLILGLFMTFKLIFTLIQSLIDPNKFSDNQKGFGPVIVRCIVSIVLLGVTPTIFREAFEIQNLIVGNENSDNVIYKLIVGTVPSNDASSFGKVLSTEMFFSFYQDEVSPFINNTSINWDEIGEVDIDELNSVDNIKKIILEGRSFSYARSYLGVQTNRTYVIEFDELFCIAVGAVLFYLLIIYCIQTAIRVFQLAYLQLIAPVPILSYISNPDGAFKKWIKQCTTTFLDLFIRLAIIYFVVALSSEIFDQLNNANSILMLSLRDASSSLITWVKVFLIIGLLLFAKKVPELLKDLFPNLGGGAASLSMGLQSPKKLWQDTLSKTPVGWAAGAATGAAIGLIGGHGVGGRLKGLVGGLTSGGYNAIKGKKLGEIATSRAERNRQNRQNIAVGSTWGGRTGARLRNSFGFETKTEQIDRQIHDIDTKDIRPIDERIKAIGKDPRMEQKRKNDAVLGAYKAMQEEAEKQLLKAGPRSDPAEKAASDKIRGLKADLEMKRANVGKSIRGSLITKNDLYAAENAYQSALKTEANNWIDRNATTNTVVINSLTTMSNETGTMVANATDASTARQSASTSNQTLAADIASLEFEKQELERQKAYHEGRKEDLNKSKEKPQIDENAIKNRK